MSAALGVSKGQLVAEIGLDDDCDDAIRAAVAAAADSELLDESTDEVVDVVMLWFRDEDDDLVDALVDALHPLGDNGSIWLLTPKPGRPGHVSPQEVAEAAPTAGLQQTSTISASSNWQGTRLVPRGTKR